MPYIRKTPRRPSRHVITLSALTTANWQVIDELENHGFWHERLEDIDVCLVPLSFACYGWFRPDGHIYIPAVTGASLCDLITGHHTRLVEGKRFRKVFCAVYHSPHPVWEYHPDHHLTRYAAAMPCEDFAETFHHYLRHKGRLPVRLTNKPEIIRKWEFVKWMAGKTARRS